MITSHLLLLGKSLMEACRAAGPFGGSMTSQMLVFSLAHLLEIVTKSFACASRRGAVENQISRRETISLHFLVSNLQIQIVKYTCSLILIRKSCRIAGQKKSMGIMRKHHH